MDWPRFQCILRAPCSRGFRPGVGLFDVLFGTTRAAISNLPQSASKLFNFPCVLFTLRTRPDKDEIYRNPTKYFHFSNIYFFRAIIRDEISRKKILAKFKSSSLYPIHHWNYLICNNSSKILVVCIAILQDFHLNSEKIQIYSLCNISLIKIRWFNYPELRYSNISIMM